jgi:hypothetical protein
MELFPMCESLDRQGQRMAGIGTAGRRFGQDEDDVFVRLSQVARL